MKKLPVLIARAVVREEVAHRTGSAQFSITAFENGKFSVDYTDK